MIKIKKSWNRNPFSLFFNNIRVKYFPKKIAVSVARLREKWLNSENQIFKEVNIETISLCNNNCSFCPVSLVNNKRPRIYMEDEVFKKIIDNLRDLNFQGKIFPYTNNELLLDKKIFQRINYIKEKLGDNVAVSIETNGKLLTLEKIYEFFEVGVDQIYINDYGDDIIRYLFFNRNIRKIFKEIDINKITQTVNLRVSHRLKKQLLSDRGGKVKGRKINSTDKYKFCDFPFYQLNINPKGEVYICCRDSYWEEIIGDIKNDKLEEIWSNEKYKEIRRGFLNNERICSLCKNCSSNGSITI